jgi:hypothetical protein
MLEDRPLFTADGELEGDDGSDDARAQLAVAATTVAETYVRELQAFRNNLAAHREAEITEQATVQEVAP